MVVGEGDNHDRADDDLAVDDNRAILDRVHACWELLGCRQQHDQPNKHAIERQKHARNMNVSRHRSQHDRG